MNALAFFVRRFQLSLTRGVNVQNFGSSLYMYLSIFYSQQFNPGPLYVFSCRATSLIILGWLYMPRVSSLPWRQSPVFQIIISVYMSLFFSRIRVLSQSLRVNLHPAVACLGCFRLFQNIDITSLCIISTKDHRTALLPRPTILPLASFYLRNRTRLFRQCNHPVRPGFTSSWNGLLSLWDTSIPSSDEVEDSAKSRRKALLSVLKRLNHMAREEYSVPDWGFGIQNMAFANIVS